MLNYLTTCIYFSIILTILELSDITVASFLKYIIKTIDEVLSQYDRKSIKKFLKRDADGNVKPSLSEHIKDGYKAESLKTSTNDNTAVKAR